MFGGDRTGGSKPLLQSRRKTRAQRRTWSTRSPPLTSRRTQPTKNPTRHSIVPRRTSLMQAAFTICFSGNECSNSPVTAFQSFPEKSALPVTTRVAFLLSCAAQTAPYDVREKRSIPRDQQRNQSNLPFSYPAALASHLQ